MAYSDFSPHHRLCLSRHWLLLVTILVHLSRKPELISQICLMVLSDTRTWSLFSYWTPLNDRYDSCSDMKQWIHSQSIAFQLKWHTTKSKTISKKPEAVSCSS